MVPRIRPTTAIIRALINEVPVTLLKTMNPNTIREKNSGGPKARAASARGGARNVSPKIAMVPPMNEPVAEMASAGPARPCWAIWYPSMHVMTEAVSPGTLRRMDVVEPPYMAP